MLAHCTAYGRSDVAKISTDESEGILMMNSEAIACIRF